VSTSENSKHGVINRSWLFMPAGEQRFHAKIGELGADVYVLDLEDAVYRTKKKAARTVLRQLDLENGEFQSAVRVNPLTSRWGQQDVIEALRAGVGTILYPKADSRREILELQDLIREHHSGPDEVGIAPIIETEEGLRNADSVIQASSQVQYVVFGSEDFLADCGITFRGFVQDNSLLSHALSQLSLLCSRYDKWLIDCAVPLFHSPDEIDSFRRECKYSRRIGARGKLAIHPRQVEHVNEIFGEGSFHQLPGIAEKVKRIVEKMKSQEKSAIRFENRLVGIPEIRKYLKQIDVLLANTSDEKENLRELRESLREVLPDAER